MAPPKSPLSGYNHNLKYKGRVYHVQTEDSGLDNPHIFTHCFHSGSILKTLRREYSQLVNEADWERQVRALMQVLHKEMMKELLHGDLDESIVQFFGQLEPEVPEELPMATLPPPPQREARSAEPAAPPPPRPSSGPLPAARPLSTAMPAAPGPARPFAPPLPPPPADPRLPSTTMPAARPLSTAMPAARPLSTAMPVAGAPARPAGVVVSMPVVIVGGPAGAPPPARPASAVRPVVVAPAPVAPPPPSTPIKNVPESIFGSDLISEKSLDEVILAYLAEDMKDD